MNAPDFGARALAAQAAASQQAFLFTQLAERAVPARQKVLVTLGHSEPGIGAATYIADDRADEALLAAHPLAAIRTRNGRIFRLAPQHGGISVEQCGALGDDAGDFSRNDQPAIQAALDYAASADIRHVTFEHPRYAIWATERTSTAITVHARDGHPLVVTSSLRMTSACGGTRLHFRARDGSSMEDGWYLIKRTGTSAQPDHVWRGGGLFVLGDPDSTNPARLAIDELVIEDIAFDGGRVKTDASGAVDTTTGDGWDTSDKGFWVQNVLVGTIRLSNVEICGFKGELFYYGGRLHGPRITLDGCHFHTTNANAHNPGVLDGVTARHCRFGNAFQPVEAGGGSGSRYIDCEFYDGDRSAIWGGPTPEFGPTYAFATRDPQMRVPWLELDNCHIRNIPNFRIGSWTRGRVRTTDSVLLLPVYGQNRLTDVDLEFDAWIDRAHNIAAVEIYGPPSETTQAPGAPAGTYVDVARRVRLNAASVRATAAARDGGRFWAAVYRVDGMFDPDTVTIGADDCEAKRYVETAGNFRGLPMVHMPRRYSVPAGSFGQIGGATWTYPATNAPVAIVPKSTGMVVFPSGGGTHDISFPATHASAEGQRFRVHHGGHQGGVLKFSPGATGLSLDSEIRLATAWDFAEFEFSKRTGKWRPVVIERQAPRVLTGSLSAVEPGEIVAGASAAFTVPVSGAEPGDFAQAAFSAPLGGLLSRCEISQSGSAQVTVFNPGPAAATVQTTSIFVQVLKQ